MTEMVCEDCDKTWHSAAYLEKVEACPDCGGKLVPVGAGDDQGG